VLHGPIDKLKSKLDRARNVAELFVDNMISKVRGLVENSFEIFKPSAILFNAAIKATSGIKFGIHYHVFIKWVVTVLVRGFLVSLAIGLKWTKRTLRKEKAH
jgi:hypothetical protein